MKVRLFALWLLWWLVLAMPAQAADPPVWKYENLAVVIQHSGAHMRNAPVFVEVLNRLAAQKPPQVLVAVFGFEDKFKQKDEVRFSREARELLHPTADANELHESFRELLFRGPSPIFDCLDLALKWAAGRESRAILLLANGIDNASQMTFEDALAAAEKAAVPILAFYFPNSPAMGGDGRMKKLAKNTGGQFIDLRTKDPWEQLLSALRRTE